MDFSYNNFYQSPSTRYKTLKPKDDSTNNNYEKAETIPADAKPLENLRERQAPKYDMQGIKPFNGEFPDAKPVQRWTPPQNYSTPEETYISKEEALEIFSPEELDTYFEYKYVTKSRDNGERQDLWLAYTLKSGIVINGENIKTVQQLIEALNKNDPSSSAREKTLKPENSEVDNNYEKAESVPSDVKPLENLRERQAPKYDMQGIEPYSGARPNAKPLQRLNRDTNYSTPIDTYLSKEEVIEKFTQEEIEKYFEYKYVYKSRENGARQDMWLAYVIKSGLEINGIKITTIDELINVLSKKDE